MFRCTLNYWINSLCVDKLTVTALLSLKFIEHITLYKIILYFLCWIATDRRFQLQIKHLNKYLKVLRRFLFIHRGSTEQSGFLRNFGKLMKEAKCIGTNLIEQISHGLPIRVEHPGVARCPGIQWVHWCAGLTPIKVHLSEVNFHYIPATSLSCFSSASSQALSLPFFPKSSHFFIVSWLVSFSFVC